jgi:hypothetical protein
VTAIIAPATGAVQAKAAGHDATQSSRLGEALRAAEWSSQSSPPRLGTCRRQEERANGWENSPAGTPKRWLILRYDDHAIALRL